VSEWSAAGLRGLVTGASSGIGRAVATRLAASGASVFLSGRDAEALGRTSEDAGGATWLARDLTVPDVEHACRDLVDAAEAQLGALDVVVVNAGEGWAGSLTEMPGDVVDRLLAIDLAAPIHLTRLVAPAMADRGSGHLVFVGSIAGRVGVPGESVYAAAKGGLALFASSLRGELAGTGVRVSLVTPGVVATPFFERRGRPYDRSFPRPVPPGRVADAVMACLERHRPEVFTPSWLAVAPRVQGAAPRLYDRMARRFG
jgi:short-subunit dehydrogenase